MLLLVKSTPTVRHSRDCGGFKCLTHRFYDPTTATFLTRDPLEAATRSTYGYVQGDPLNNTDPAGMMGWHCDTSGIGVDAGKIRAEQAKEHNQQQASEGSGLCFNNPFSKSGSCISIAKRHPVDERPRRGRGGRWCGGVHRNHLWFMRSIGRGHRLSRRNRGRRPCLHIRRGMGSVRCR